MRRIPKKLAVIALTAVVGSLMAFTATPASAAPIAYTILSTDGCQLSTIDLATGTVTPLSAGPSGAACVDDLAVAPDGTVYGISDFVASSTSATLVTFNPTTGAVVTTVPFTGDFDESFTARGGIAVDRNGVLYASFTTNEDGCSDLTNDAFVCLYRVDPATAAATLIGPSGFDQIRTNWLTTNCDDAMLTALDEDDFGPFSAPDEVTEPGAEGEAGAQAEPPGLPDSFADDGADPQSHQEGLDISPVDESTGAVTQGPLMDADIFGIEWAPPTGPLYAIGEDGDGDGVFTVDPATGALTRVADLDVPQIGGITTLAMAVTCPEELVVVFTG
jgi:hypothetical protein